MIFFSFLHPKMKFMWKLVPGVKGPESGLRFYYMRGDGTNIHWYPVLHFWFTVLAGDQISSFPLSSSSLELSILC